MSVTIYGLKNCDTMKKAFAWLAEHGVAYDFHDYRKAGITTEAVAGWCEKLGWQALLNTRGTTWRKLDPARQSCAGADDAIALMVEYPSLIRRPVMDTGSGGLLAGFDPARYTALLQGQGATT